MMISIYAIIFHTDEDFNLALANIYHLNPRSFYPEDVEMRWSDERSRKRAINRLKKLDIEVDTYEM